MGKKTEKATAAVKHAISDCEASVMAIGNLAGRLETVLKDYGGQVDIQNGVMEKYMPKGLKRTKELEAAVEKDPIYIRARKEMAALEKQIEDYAFTKKDLVASAKKEAAALESANKDLKALMSAKGVKMDGEAKDKYGAVRALADSADALVGKIKALT